jgi:hypothetical protein
MPDFICVYQARDLREAMFANDTVSDTLPRLRGKLVCGKLVCGKLACGTRLSNERGRVCDTVSRPS